MSDRTEWEGNPTQLLNELSNQLFQLEISAKEWPKSASVLGKRLVRAKLFLQVKGIQIDPYRENGKRTITFRKLAKAPVIGVIHEKYDDRK